MRGKRAFQLKKNRIKHLLDEFFEINFELQILFPYCRKINIDKVGKIAVFLF